MKPRVQALAFAAALTALAGGAPRAAAQFACSPATVSAGAEIHLTSTARFGSTPPAGVAIEAFAGVGSPRPLIIHNWTSNDILVRLPPGIPDGAYGVRITTPDGPPQQSPSCVTVRTLVAAPLAPRTVVAGVVAATLDSAVDGDYVCAGTTKITLWGSHFTPGTEATRHIAWPGERLLNVSETSGGKTMVELGATGRAFPMGDAPPSDAPRLVIRDAGTMELTLSRCILLWPGLKARIWFPDGTKSAWQRVRTSWDR